jgi:hypothetical protein
MPASPDIALGCLRDALRSLADCEQARQDSRWGAYDIADDAVRLARVRVVEAARVLIEAVDAEAKPAEAWDPRVFCACGHERGMHGGPGGGPPSGICAVPYCECRSFVPSPLETSR